MGSSSNSAVSSTISPLGNFDPTTTSTLNSIGAGGNRGIGGLPGVGKAFGGLGGLGGFGGSGGGSKSTPMGSSPADYTKGAPQYQGIMTNGVLDSNFAYDPSKLDARGEGNRASMYDDLYGRATAEGPSKSAEYLLGQQKVGQDLAGADLWSSSRSDANSGMTSLAMRGGLDSGARERMLRGSNRDIASGKTRLAAMGNADRLGILSNDEQQKLGLLQGLHGYESDIARYNNDLTNQGKVVNLGNKIEDRRFGYGAKHDLWTKGMAAMGADKTAVAMENEANRQPGFFEDPFGYFRR